MKFISVQRYQLACRLLVQGGGQINLYQFDGIKCWMDTQDIWSAVSPWPPVTGCPPNGVRHSVLTSVHLPHRLGNKSNKCQNKVYQSFLSCQKGNRGKTLISGIFELLFIYFIYSLLLFRPEAGCLTQATSDQVRGNLNWSCSIAVFQVANPPKYFWV